MKKLLVVLMTVALFAFPVTGFCLDFDEMKFGVNGGILMPMGDLDDAVDMGFIFGGQAMMPSGVMDELSIGLCVSYGMASGEIDTFVGDIDVDFTIIEILPSARYLLGESGDMTFFGQAGIGFGLWEVDVDGGGSEDDTEIGFAIGGGVTFMENFEAVVLYKTFDEPYTTITVGYNF